MQFKYLALSVYHAAFQQVCGIFVRISQSINQFICP